MLVVAAETLLDKKLPDACAAVVRLAFADPGVADPDQVRLHLIAAMRLAEAADDVNGLKEVEAALTLDRNATLPPGAPMRVRQWLADAQAKAPDPSAPRPRTEAPEREPPTRSLLRAIDALYQGLQVEGADVVLELSSRYRPFPAEDQVQLDLRKGILRMETFQEAEARRAFQDALAADRNARLPEYAPPKTVRVLEEVRSALMPPPVTSTVPPQLLSARRNNIITLNVLSVLTVATSVVGKDLLLGYEAALHPNITGVFYLGPHWYAPRWPTTDYGLQFAGAARYYPFGDAPLGPYLTTGVGCDIFMFPDGGFIGEEPIGNRLQWRALAGATVGYQHVFGIGLTLNGGLGGGLYFGGYEGGGGWPFLFVDASVGYAF